MPRTPLRRCNPAGDFLRSRALVPYPAALAQMEIHNVLPATQIRILTLRRLANADTGLLETTTEKLTRLVGAKRGAAQKALRALERAGWLHMEYVRGRTVHLRIWFGGFPKPEYPNQRKRRLIWDDLRQDSETILLPSVSDTRLLLRLAHSHLLQVLNSGHLHLRVNVMMPVGNDCMKVVYTYNMDHDADRDLEFTLGSGASGRCWLERKTVICDLKDAQKTFATKWKLTKEEQVRVRPSLRSLLSVPVFEAGRRSRARKLGVLNFDSDADVRQKFHAGVVQDAAGEAAALVGTWLRSRIIHVG